MWLAKLRFCEVTIQVLSMDRARIILPFSEVFVIVSLTLFLPICLEQFARDNGLVAPERILPCSSNTTSTFAETLADAERCQVKIGWVWIDTASFRWAQVVQCIIGTHSKTGSSLYVYSISVALQALTVISMGGVADYRMHIFYCTRIPLTLDSDSATQKETIAFLRCPGVHLNNDLPHTSI